MDNAVIENIKSRRSIRKYLSKDVPDELLNKVVEAGTYAPSGRSLQSSTIVVIKNKKVRDELSKLNASIMKADIDPYYGSPNIIIVLADSNVNTYVEDGSLVLMNMMLAAHSLGLGTVWVHREREMFETSQGKALLKSWGLDPSLKGVGALAIGYPDGEGTLHPHKDNYVIEVK